MTVAGQLLFLYMSHHGLSIAHMKARITAFQKLGEASSLPENLVSQLFANSRQTSWTTDI
jgi:hypothetical protein